MSREKVITTAPADEVKRVDAALRPKLLKEVIGQRKVAERLEIAVRASKKLNEPLGHILFGDGMSARTISMALKRFTLIGATTRSGMLSGPMRDRFKMHEHLEFYSVEELAQIVRINARKLNTPITDDAALELAQRSRGTPRIANARLWWARQFATSEFDGHITLDVARAALAKADVDREGLDKQDRRYLEVLIDVFGGGPTGVEALAATMNLPADTLSDEVEPYLLREQFIVRTPRGRVATARAYEVLGRPMKPRGDG